MVERGALIILDRVDPTLLSTIKGYVRNFSRLNLWRVENIMDQDDVMQEAMFTLLIMEKRLIEHGKDSTILTPKQYMAFFKMSFSNHFHTLSIRDTRYKRMKTESSFYQETDEENYFSISDLVSDDNIGFIEVLVEQAPSEVKAVLNLLFNAPKELLESASIALKKDITDNTVLCRLLGFDPKETNLVNLTKEYLNNF